MEILQIIEEAENEDVIEEWRNQEEFSFSLSFKMFAEDFRRWYHINFTLKMFSNGMAMVLMKKTVDDICYLLKQCPWTKDSNYFYLVAISKI